MYQGNKPSAPPVGAPAPPPAAPAMASGGFPVKLSMLTTPDDSDNMQTPAVGDMGECTVGYKVVSVSGDSAVIQPTAINGQDLSGDDTQPDSGAGDSDDSSEGSDLQAQALNQ